MVRVRATPRVPWRGAGGTAGDRGGCGCNRLVRPAPSADETGARSPQGRPSEAGMEEEGVAAPNPPITSILPDEGWAPLLEIIVREAPSASVIEVNTAGMQVLATRMLQEVGRQDVTVILRPPRGAPLPPAHGG